MFKTFQEAVWGTSDFNEWFIISVVYCLHCSTTSSFFQLSVLHYTRPCTNL